MTVLGVGQPIFTAGSELGGPTCQWLRTKAEPYGGYYVEGADRVSIYEWQPYPPRSRHFVIAGFDAITGRTHTADVDRMCQIVVGVAEGQIIEIAYTYRGKDPAFTREAVCGKAREAAEMVMRTLLSRAGG